MKLLLSQNEHYSPTLAKTLRGLAASADLLIETALTNQRQFPDDHLEGYMNRYWLVSPEQAAALNCRPVRIHNILRKDHDRHPHDHPWSFISVILKGGYDEELLDEDGDKRHQIVAPGDSYCRQTGQYHRIVAITDEPVWTLCILDTPHPTGWGFLVDGKHVDSHTYLQY